MAIKTVTQGALEYLAAEGIRAPHAFTTRLGGVSQGQFSSLNLAFHRGDAPENVEKNYRILADALGFGLNALVLTRQIHSDIIRTVTRKDAKGLDHRAYSPCDGLITCEPGTALGIFTADCTPILLQDPVTGAVGAAHAGWRGTAADIAGKTVRAMVREFGCCPADIRAAIGPNIGPCCFQTDADVPQAMRKALGAEAEKSIRPSDSKFYVNLKEINTLWLKRSGVEHIEVSPLCTACRQDLFWSHRRVGQQRGSQGAVIICKEVSQ